jgi:hypothetical protein
MQQQEQNLPAVTKNLGGRPRKFQDPRDLERRAERLFERWDRDKEPYTITGLALELGFNGRQQLIEYERLDRFTAVLKKARSRVERWVECMLWKAHNPAAAIFWLKNAGWTDRQDLVVSGSITVQHTVERTVPEIDVTPKR